MNKKILVKYSKFSNPDVVKLCKIFYPVPPSQKDKSTKNIRRRQIWLRMRAGISFFDKSPYYRHSFQSRPALPASGIGAGQFDAGRDKKK